MAEKDAISCSWSGGGDAGLRTEPGRYVAELRKMISGRSIEREGLLSFLLFLALWLRGSDSVLVQLRQGTPDFLEQQYFFVGI
jgi:hypothetical protein